MFEQYIHELPGGKYREASIEEITEAKATGKTVKDLKDQEEAIKKRLGEIYKSCKHIVCSDAPGLPYNVRTCLACGYQSLL